MQLFIYLFIYCLDHAVNMPVSVLKFVLLEATHLWSQSQVDIGGTALFELLQFS